MLVLCGSSVSFMQDEVLAERSPLYGRRTGQLELQPFSYRDSAAFFPEYSLEDNLRAYGMLGGIPMYLGQFDGDTPIAANVQRAILQPGAVLYDEPEYLLRMELRDPRTYNSILQAIASGLTKRSEIADRVGVGSTQMSPYIATLEKLRITERVSPVADRAPERPSRGRYFVRDNFLRFWYRFVLPNRSLLEMGEGERVWRERIEPHLDEHLSFVFEDVCREYVQRHAREKLPVLAQGEVGRHWHKDAEIEVVCRNTDGSTYCGECKWSRQPMDLRELAALEEKAKTLPPSWQANLRYVLFSRAGFKPELRDREDGKRVILVDLEDLYGTKPRTQPTRG
jgi:AAA+ ATPase superfamily predicted ATPase